MPVQIDGEPWMQGAGHVIVRPILTQVKIPNQRGEVFHLLVL